MMARRSASGILFGLLVLALIVAGLFVALGTMQWDTSGAVVIGPILLLVSLPALRRQAEREGDPTLLTFLVIALVVKLTGTLLRHFITFQVYEAADATQYHTAGTALADAFRAGEAVELGPLSGTNFLKVITGALYTITAPSLLGGFLVFSWLGFWGLFWFYRAFRIAVPNGLGRRYARLIFFLPSLVYWPSSIGKESWMMFALGITAYGVARALSGNTFRGLVGASFGLWLCALVRPHVAAMAGAAIAAGALLRKPSAELRHLAPLAKILSVLIIGVVAWITVAGADTFLAEQGISTDQGLTTALDELSDRTADGNSQFDTSAAVSPSEAPLAIITVLFRPTILEANNASALATAVEGTFLLVLSIVRFRSIGRAVRSARQFPYIGFTLLYCTLFIVAFSGVGNFGILARQRVQILPFFLVLLCFPSGPNTSNATTASSRRPRAVNARS